MLVSRTKEAEEGVGHIYTYLALDAHAVQKWLQRPSDVERQITVKIVDIE